MANIEELAKVDAPKIPKTGSIGFQEALGIQEPYLKRKAQIQTDIGKATEKETLAKQRQQEGLAEAKAGVQETYAGAEKAARAGLQEKLAEEPLPEFIPTKDTVNDIAGLFSLIGVIGMIAGKQNAMQALSAMNGMLEGHSKGRLELYRQERDTFDKNFRAMLKKHEEFRKEMEDAIKTAATDKEAGMAKAELAATKAGSEIVKAQLRKGDLMGAYKLVDESGKGAQNALATEAKMREAAAGRAAAMQRTQMQIEAADRRAELKAGAGEGKPLKETEIKKIEGVESVADGLKKLKEDFKPAYASLGFLGFGADLSLEAKRRLGDEEGRKAVSWWSRYQQLQAPNRHALFGATLTGNELKNYQSFTARPGDDPKVVKDFLTDQINYINDVASGTRRSFEAAGYRVPEARPRDYFSTFSGGETRSFNTVEEAEAANLPKGTEITIGGRRAVVE